MNNKLSILLLIAFTQYLMRYAVIYPVTQQLGVEIQISGLNFLCLVVSTMCIAASGYMKKWCKIKILYITLYATGIILGCYVVRETGIIRLLSTYIAITTILWFYAFIYKSQLLITNIAKALFYALVPLLVLLDIPPLYTHYGQLHLNYSVFWILGVAAFVFLTALSHDITEDTENFEGDVNYDSQSLPFVMGAQFAKWTIIAINATITVLLFLLYIFYLSKISVLFPLFYILLLLVVPLLSASRKIYKASTATDYRKARKHIQIAILFGIAYSGVLWMFGSA